MYELASRPARLERWKMLATVGPLHITLFVVPVPVTTVELVGHLVAVLRPAKVGARERGGRGSGRYPSREVRTARSMPGSPRCIAAIA